MLARKIGSPRPTTPRPRHRFAAPRTSFRRVVAQRQLPNRTPGAGSEPRAARLDEAEVARLHAALVDVLTEARGTMAEQVGGAIQIPKAADRLFAVHGRAGEPCFVCGDTVRSVWMGQRETSYCPTCQTAGRVLADRRRSKFLR